MPSMSKSYNYNVELKKTCTRENILYDLINVYFRTCKSIVCVKSQNLLSLGRGVNISSFSKLGGIYALYGQIDNSKGQEA